MLGSIGAGLQIAGGLGLFRSDSGKKQARLNKQLILDETKEEARRMERDLGKVVGSAEAAVGASGIKMAGSPDLVIKDIKREGRKQVDWLKKSGAQRAEIGVQAGASQDRMSKLSGLSTIAQGLGGLFS